MHLQSVILAPVPEVFHSPVTLLEQEAGFLGSILLVALWLVDAVAVARILPVEVLLEHMIIDHTLHSSSQAHGNT